VPARESVHEVQPRDHPHPRAEAHTKVSAEDKAILADTYTSIDPAAVQRIQARILG